MPTSKARKGRIVARLKQKQKIALEKKSSMRNSKPLAAKQRKGKSANTLDKVMDYLRYAMQNTEGNFPKGEKENSPLIDDIYQNSNGNVDDGGQSLKVTNNGGLQNVVAIGQEEAKKRKITLDEIKDGLFMESEKAAGITENKTEELSTENSVCGSNDKNGFSFLNFTAFAFKIWKIFTRVS